MGESTSAGFFARLGRSRSRMTRKKDPSRRAISLRGLLPLAAGLAIWQLVAEPNSPYFPPPSEWIQGLTDLWREGSLRPALSASLATFITGFLLAVAVGSLIGILVGRSQTLDQIFGPFFEYLRVIPPAAIVPIVVLFTGYTERMKLVVVVFASAWPVLLQVRTTARTINETLLDVGRSVGFSRLQIIWKVMLPATTPGVIAGARLAAPIVLIVVLLVEVVTQVEGIGALIERSRQFFVTERVYGLIILAGALALTINVIVANIESFAARRHLMPGRV